MDAIIVTHEIAAKAHRAAAKAHREHPRSEEAQDATDDAAECTHHLTNKSKSICDADEAALEACWGQGDSQAAADAHERAAAALEAIPATAAEKEST